jgi:NAD(P)H-hydrate epimerase
VVVLAGKGNNGNDGREAARRLRRQGVRVLEVDAGAAPDELPACDLLIDAAYGTGFRGEYRPPRIRPGTRVLAVDIPSGVDGVTGEASGTPLRAERTVTFQALKPGLVLEPGAALAGDVEVADIGLSTASARTHLITADDAASWLPEKSPSTHKWKSAVWVIGGSPGLEGAAVLTSTAAMRAGAGYVRWSAPGMTPRVPKPTEVVGTELPSVHWSTDVLDDAGRFEVITVGNGLGLTDTHAEEIRRVVAESPVPVVVDADGLTLLGRDAEKCATPSTVLTPHDGEFARLAGAPPGPDRFSAARELSDQLGGIVLLKGPCTIVAAPGGLTLAMNHGDERLATLGSGDVLTGIIAALTAQGLEPFRSAAGGGFLHASAAALGWRHGLVAGDIPERVPAAIDQLREHRRRPGS